MKIIYQATFLEKLFGKNYKWWYCLIYNINLSLAYKTTTVFVIFRDFLPLVISLIIYGSFLETKDYAVYFLVSNIFLKIAAIVWDISWDLRNDIKMGFLVSKLMRPSNLLLHYLCISLGANFYSLLINFIILFTSLFFVKPQNVFNQNLIPALFLVFIGIVIFYFVEIIVGSLTFWFTETAQIIETKNILIPFLAGALVFLETNQITKLFIYTPFAFAVHHPMQIYLGKYNQSQINWSFVGGIFWAIILYFLSNFVFKLGLRKNESVGL